MIQITTFKGRPTATPLPCRDEGGRNRSTLLRNTFFTGLMALLMAFLPSAELFSQVSVSYNFDTGLSGWTAGGTAPTGAFSWFSGATACGGAGGSVRRNVWSGTTNGSLVSPAIPGNNGGLITLNYDYKIRVWSGNTLTPASTWGSFQVQYSTVGTSGPWTTIATISNEPQGSGAACLPRSHTFTPPPSANIWIRYTTTWAGGDNWWNFDNVVLSQAAGSPCVGTPAPGATVPTATSVCPGGTTTLTLQNATPGSGVTYQWQSSPDNVTWSNIGGATLSSYTATVAASTWYRCNVTCSGNTGTSTPVQINTSFINCYCASSASNIGDTEILNVTLGSLNNNSNCITAAPGPGSILERYSNFRTLAPVSIDKIVPQNLSVFAGSCSGTLYDRIFKVFIDGNQDGDFADAGEEVYVSPALPFGSGPGSPTTATINIPGTFLDGVTGMRVVLVETTTPGSVTPCGTYSWGETEDYLINLTTPAVCTTTPAASNALSTSTSVCSGANFTLSLSNPYAAAGFTYQWQSSPDNITYTNIAGATSATRVQTQTAATWYRCIITCSFGGSPTTSAPIQVNMAPAYNCNCVSSATSAADTDIINVTVGTLNNSAACLATGGAGSVSGMYQNYKGITPPNLAQSASIPVAVSISGCNAGPTHYATTVRVYIDYNQDGDFLDAGETVFAPASTVGGTPLVQTVSGNFVVPCTALPGLTAMRVVAQEGGPSASCGTFTWGETEDYLVNITAPAACSGTPAASNAISSVATTCPGVPFTLTLSASYASCDFSLQWERSSDNISYAPILGATSAVQTIASQLSASYYRCVITCIPSGQTTTSTEVFVAQSPLLGCYCPSSANSTGWGDITGVTLGTISNASTCATVAPGAGSINQRYSNYTSLQTDLTKTVNNAMSISLLNCSSGSFNYVTKVFIDYNQDGDHLDVGETVYTSPITALGTTPTSLNFNFTVPITATDGLTLMRIITHETSVAADVQPCNSLATFYEWGETEDYLVNIITPPSCSGTPTPGTLPATLQILNNTNTTLNPVGLGIELNLAYEWQESDDNGVGDPWAPVVGGSGAATPVYTTPNLNTTRWYRLRVECTTTTDVAFTNAIQITTVGGASCADPYIVGSLPFTLNFSSNGAGNDIGLQTSSCSNLYGGGQDVVFQFTAPSAGNYEISVVNTSNTRFIGWFLKSGTDCNLTTLGSQLGCAVSTGTYNSAHNVVSIPSAGTYYVIVDYAAPVTQSNFFIRIRQNPAAPANDNCASAAAITQSGLSSCGAPVIGTLAGATSSGVPVQCTGGNADDDVWYSFVATSDAAVIDVATTTNGVVESGANLAWEFFSGSCGSLTPLFCRNASASRGVTENATVVGLTVGQTYYIRLYDMDAGYGSALGNFTLCVYTPAPPANNDCSGATVLAVNPGCVTTTGNTVAATQSLPATACNGFTGNADDDVWYQFTIAAPTNINIEVTSLNNTFDPVMDLYTGSCGSPVALFCADNSLQGGVERITRVLSAGTYFIRLYHFGVGTGAGGAHSICVTSTFPAVAPSNDNTCTAVTLPVVNSCSPEGPFSSSAATRTLNLTVAQQGDGNPNDDVWFRFTTDNVTSTVSINVQGGAGYDAVFQVYEMSNCKTITALFPPVDVTFANGLESQTVFGLAPNTTYYIRVFDWAGTNPTGQFTICTFVTPPPPNDAAVNAILLTQQNSATCFGPTFGYTINGTAGDATAAPCAGNADDNVWYRFVASSTTATITVTGTQGFDPVVNLRGGNLPGTSIQCANATGADGTETISATGLTQGATYYIQVYGFGANPVAWGTFDICVFGVASPPVNDNCAGAIALPNASPCAPVTGLLTGATQSQAASSCGFGGTSPAAFDVWYSFIASSPQATLTPVSTSGTGDMVVQMFSGNCGTLNPLGCIDNDPAPGVENLVINGLTPGQTYYARVYIFGSNGPGTATGPDPNFSLCYTGVPPANDNPCGATLTTVSSGRVDINTSNLGATNVTGLSPTMPNGSFTSWNNDVWFRSVVPANGVIAINVLGIGFSDTKIRLYTSSDNTCNGTFTAVAWDDDNGPGLGSYVYHSGLTPGSTVFYAVDGFSAANFGQFRMNVNDGWLWTGAGGFTYNGNNNWINQGATDGFPNPSTTTTVVGSTGWASAPGTVIINIPAVTNQPVYTANTSIGGVKFVSGVFTQAKFTVNAGAIVTLNGTTFAGTGRGITGTSAGGRIEGNGRLDIGAAVSGQTVLVNYPTRFRLAVTALGTANVQSNGNMIFDNGASLYSGQAPPNSQVTGNITYRRQGNTSAIVYNFWSSPISNGVLSSLAAPGYVPNLYQYNTPTATGLDYLGSQAGWQALTPATPMVPGKGYIATGAGLANFTGLPNQNQPIGPALQNGAGNVNNFNLVGNPYPAPVSASQFITANAGAITGSIYIWDDDASAGVNYAAGDFIVTNGIGTVNGPNSGAPFSGNIGACQGFFVEKQTAFSGNIVFNHAMKVYGTNSEFFNVEDASRLRLRMENSNGVGTETLLAFTADATDGVDPMYDATRLQGNATLSLYTFNGTGEYVIQAWPTLATERIFPLGTVNTVTGPSSITVNQFENFDPSTVVYLEDVVNGVFHNLTENPTYNFENTGLNTGVNGEEVRFKLHFRAPIAVASSMDCSGMELGKIIVANPNNTPVALEVVNENNAVIATAAAFVGEHEVTGLAAGAYTLNLSYADGASTSKTAVVESNGMTTPATFIASATTVTIADAIIEFQGTAQGATQFIWNFGDGSAEVTGDINPVHAYNAPGVYTVTFTALNNGCGSTATTTITVTNDATGIGSAANANGFTIFPNPASEVANLLLNVDRSTTDVTISIHDAAGRLVSTQQVNEVRSGAMIALPIEALSNGVYQVTVEGKSFRNTGRLTIAK